MIEEGYYSNRIKELEKRKYEVQSKFVTAKLTLESINNEIIKCEEAMQNLGSQQSKEIMEKNNLIKTLRKTISKQEEHINHLNRVISDKDSTISELEEVIKRYEQLLASTKAQNVNLKAKLRGVSNVFEDQVLLDQYANLISK